MRGQLIGGLISGASAAAGKAAAAAHGGIIGGQAMVPGDHPQNDTVPAMLSPGEIVIPRSMAHNPEKAKEFIDYLLKEKNDVGYGEVLKARSKKKAS
jgi:spermidine/putrescine-binding protein